MCECVLFLLTKQMSKTRRPMAVVMAVAVVLVAALAPHGAELGRLGGQDYGGE